MRGTWGEGQFTGSTLPASLPPSPPPEPAPTVDPSVPRDTSPLQSRCSMPLHNATCPRYAMNPKF
eukprot:362039-Chlamydomonas_euryale.AAC.1